jgi:hypothetical protein
MSCSVADRHRPERMYVLVASHRTRKEIKDEREINCEAER